MSEYHIEVENVSFSRGNRPIFKNLSLTIPRGKIVAILGPSGTGKTTLLKLIAGQLKPESGEVRVNGQVMHELSLKQIFAMRRKMGMLFQGGALLTDMNVFENVSFPLREHTRLSKSMIRDLVMMKLETVGLRGAVDLMPNELSGGMSRRVALARSLAMDPDLMMYDEPFTGLDPITMSTIVRLIKTFNEALGVTSLLISHDIEESLSIADYIYLIADGSVVEAGTPDEMKASSSEWVSQFIHRLPTGPVGFHYPADDDYLNAIMRSSK